MQFAPYMLHIALVGGDQMLEKDSGVYGGSDYYVMTPSEVAKSYFYYLTMCGHMHTCYGYAKKREYYPDMLIMCIISGTMMLRYGGKEYRLTAGTTALIDCQSPQHYFTADHCEFSFAHFGGKDIRAVYPYLYRTYGCTFQNTEHQEASKLLNAMILRFRNEQFISETECSMILYQMVFHLFPNTYNGRIVSITEPALNRVIQYIHGHLSEQISLKDLADMAHLSPYYFSRMFKKHLGSSPYDYLMKTRINRAKHLLMDTRMTVGEIADAVGFNSASRFSHAFTQRVGIAPSEFREFPV